MKQQRAPKSRRLLPSPARAAATSTTPRAAPAAASLPDDLISDILSRLPVRSVCGFRCVSRGWDALISDPVFLAAHRSHAEPLLVTISELDDQVRCDLRLMDMDGNVVGTSTKVLAGTELVSESTGSLVCVSDHCYSARVFESATGEMLVNCKRFVTRNNRVRLLPPAIALGFGRAVPSGAYKVVRVGNGGYCDVFTLEDDIEWRSSQPPPTDDGPYPHGHSASLNGVIYFLTFPLTGKLFCFDLETEKWKNTIKGPPRGLRQCKKNELVRISELNGAICLVRLTRPNNGYRCANIWILTRSEKVTWHKAYTISMDPFTYEFSPLRGDTR